MPPSNAQLQKQIDELKVQVGELDARADISDRQIADLEARVTALEEGTPPIPPDPQPPSYGPRPEPLPPEAVLIQPGESIQDFTDRYPTGTTFGLRAGIYPVMSWVTPKSGNRYIGEYGAILDGAGWQTPDSTAAAFRGHNATILDVTIQNLVIRKMPQKGIQAFKDFCARWSVLYCELDSCMIGVNIAPESLVRGCHIHHCVGDPENPDPSKRGGGYGMYYSHACIWEDNHIHDCGPEQKSIDTIGLTWRRNLVQRCTHGIWIDGNGTGSLIEDNTVEDCFIGLFPEGSVEVMVRGNTVRRATANGIFLSISRNCVVSGNTFEGCQSALVTFIDPAIVGKYAWDPDLRDNLLERNTVTVPQGGLGALFSYVGGATPESLAPYLSNAKKNFWRENVYRVMDINGWWWNWDGSKTWAQWQGQGQDSGGRVEQG